MNESMLYDAPLCPADICVIFRETPDGIYRQPYETKITMAYLTTIGGIAILCVQPSRLRKVYFALDTINHFYIDIPNGEATNR